MAGIRLRTAVITGVVLVSVAATTDMVALFDGPYRSEAQATTAIPNRFTNSTSGISFQGWLQTPSQGTPTRSRTVFDVRSGTDQLLVVFIEDDRRLGVNLTTVTGLKQFRALNLTTDSWISVGISITATELGLYASDLVASSLANMVSTTATFPLTSSPVLITTSTATVPFVSPTQTGPVSVYVLALRVIYGALTFDVFNSISTMYPVPYVSWSGADVLGLVYEKATPPTNITCPSGGTFGAVRSALYGRPTGLGPLAQANPSCDTGSLALTVVNSTCLGFSSCIIPEYNADFNFDPCPGRKKFITFTLTCFWPTTSGPPLSSAPLSRPSSSSSAAPSPLTTLSALPSSSAAPPPSQSASATSSPPQPPSSSMSRSAAAVPTQVGTSRPSSLSWSSQSSLALSPQSSSSLTIEVRSPSVTNPTSPVPHTFIPNVQAWQITLQVSTSTLGPGQYTLRNALIRDLAAVLNVPTSRFLRVEFSDQTETSTVLSMVVVVDAVSDPDGTQLVNRIVNGLQTPGSSVRTVTILQGAPPPPVPIDVVQIRLQDCEFGGPCLGTSSSTNTQETSLIWIVVVIAVGILLAVIVCCWVRASKWNGTTMAHPSALTTAHPSTGAASDLNARPMELALASNYSTQHAAVISLGPSSWTTGSIWGQTQSIVDNAPYPPITPTNAPTLGSMRLTADFGSYFSQNDLGELPLEKATTASRQPIALSRYGTVTNRTMLYQPEPDLPDF